MAGLRMIEENMRVLTPHTLNALQHLVMAMSDVAKNVGKTSLFGRDKGQIAYQKFLLKLQATIQSMVLDGLIKESTSSAEVSDVLLKQLYNFSLAFPNWQDAFEFAAHFFVKDTASGIAAIERLR